MMFRLLLAALLAGLLAPASALADASSPFVGRWAVQSGHSNLLILQVERAPGSAVLTAVLIRPKHYEWFPQGDAITNISNDYIREPATRITVAGGVLDVDMRNPEDPSDTEEWQLTLPDADHAEMQIVGAPLPPVPMIRVPPDATPYTAWEPARSFRITDHRPSNPAMTSLFNADQADRQSLKTVDWAVVIKADRDRRAAVRLLLTNNQLDTGQDYLHAAFVFQHGDKPEDYLFAHTLALIALKKGDASAVWIASASLDRYLQSIQRPQIYGTQFQTQSKTGVTTQAPYDEAFLSDVLRKELEVGSLADQAAQARAIAGSAAQPAKP